MHRKMFRRVCYFHDINGTKSYDFRLNFHSYDLGSRYDKFKATSQISYSIFLVKIV